VIQVTPLAGSLHTLRAALVSGSVQNDLYCVERDVKPYSLTHSLSVANKKCTGWGPNV